MVYNSLKYWQLKKNKHFLELLYYLKVFKYTQKIKVFKKNPESPKHFQVAGSWLPLIDTSASNRGAQLLPHHYKEADRDPVYA